MEAAFDKKDGSHRIQGDQADEHLFEKYRHIVNRFRMDIRYFFFSLSEFVDLSPELAALGSWEAHIQRVEKEIQDLAATAFKESVPSVEAITSLLNCRDKLLLTLIDAVLYQQAVLDSDLKRPRVAADDRMAYMAQHVQVLASKAESLPEMYTITSLPSAGEVGTFTFDKTKQPEGNALVLEASALPGQMKTLFDQMKSMDKELRHRRFGAKIIVSDRMKVDSDKIRKEITKLFDKCSRLENALQTSKAQRHTPWEQRLEQINQKVVEKDILSNQNMNRIHRLESELANLKADHVSLQRELQELNERNQKVTSENLPVLEETNRLLADTWATVDRLTADAALLSNMFKLQVGEYQSAVDARDAESAELTKIQRALKGERLKNTFKEDELQKKDTLYQRTVVARQEIHDSYLKQKSSIKDVEEKQQRQRLEWEEMLKTAEDQCETIRQLREEIHAAHLEIDILEQEKRAYTKEFKDTVGRPCNTLIKRDVQKA